MDHGHDDSSDYFDYEQQGSDMTPIAAPPLPLVGQYPYEAHSRRYSHDERFDIFRNLFSFGSELITILSCVAILNKTPN